jgi:hypothetical protein
MKSIEQRQVVLAGIVMTFMALASSSLSGCSNNPVAVPPLPTTPSGPAVTNADGSAKTTSVNPRLYHPVAVNDVNAISPATPVDFLEVVEFRGLPQTGAITPPRVVARRGTPCSTASNVARCKSKLRALTTSVPVGAWQEECYSCTELVGRFLVYTKGDFAAVAPDSGFFGTIDSEVEAAWTAKGTSARVVGELFEVLTTLEVDCDQVQYDVTTVSREGVMELIDRVRKRKDCGP